MTEAKTNTAKTVQAAPQELIAQSLPEALAGLKKSAVVQLSKRLRLARDRAEGDAPRKELTQALHRVNAEKRRLKASAAPQSAKGKGKGKAGQDKPAGASGNAAGKKKLAEADKAAQKAEKLQQQADRKATRKAEREAASVARQAERKAAKGAAKTE